MDDPEDATDTSESRPESQTGMPQERPRMEGLSQEERLEDHREVHWRNHQGMRCSTFVRRDDPEADAQIEAREDFAGWWDDPPAPPALQPLQGPLSDDMVFGAVVGWEMAHQEMCQFPNRCSMHHPPDAGARRVELMTWLLGAILDRDGVIGGIAVQLSGGKVADVRNATKDE